MANRVISAVLKFRDENFSDGLRRANDQAGDFGQQMNGVQDRVERFKSSASDAFKAVGAAAGALGAAGIAALGGAVAKATVDMDDSFAKLQAQTGATGADLSTLKDAAKETFTLGYGESLEEVSNAVARVKQNMQNIDNGEIANVTSNAMLLANTFDSDVNEVARGVNNTMKAFGVSSDKAFDLFTAGGQRGLNFSNEMFDNVAEYAPLFGEMGYSAEEYFGILERGAQAGVYNLDYVNDVMKEFQIRSKDGSKASSDAMGALSKDTQNVWKEYLKGNGTVSDVASTVVSELQSMDDQVAANQIGVGLFGTKWEDLEADAMYAMLGSTEAMKDFEGATNSAAEAVEGSFLNRIKSAWRDLTIGIAESANSPIGKEFLDGLASSAENMVPKIQAVVEKAFEMANTIRDNWGPIKETIIGITVAVAAFKVGMTAMTIVSAVTGFIQAYRTALATGTVAQWAMNAAMSANPIGLVIAGIAGLIAIGVLLYRNWDTVKEKAGELWAKTKEVFGGIYDWGVAKIQPVVSFFSGLYDKFVGFKDAILSFKLPDWVSSIGSKISGAAGKVAEWAGASFDVGSNRIEHDQIAQVHKDEMIIPARQAQRVRQAGGTIDNIDKLIRGSNRPVVNTISSNNIEKAPINVVIENINAKGVTVTEVVGEIVPKLKLALANM